MLNPYLEIFEFIFPKWKDGILKDDSHELLKVCDKFSWIFSYAIPTEEAINKIKEYSPIIEIGAGLGYWAWILQKENCDIEAYDDFSYHKNREYNNSKQQLWTDVKPGNANILKTIKKNNTLFLCWPINEDDGKMAGMCLDNYKGNILLYIGELEGGKTVGKLFFNKLKSEWKLIDNVILPSWPGYSDNLYIYTKRSNDLI